MSGAVTTLLVGIFMILLGGFGLWKAISLMKKCSEEVEATITDINRSRVKSGNGRKRNEYSPVLSYKVGSAQLSGTADITSIFPNKFVVGNTLTIKYDPNNPAKFCVKGKSGTLKWAIPLLLLGIAFVLASIIL